MLENENQARTDLRLQILDVLDNQVVQASEVTEADLKTMTPSTVAELETAWISPEAAHPPSLVHILNYVYRQHRYVSKFRWSCIKVNDSKHVWFILVIVAHQNHHDLLIITIRRGAVDSMFQSTIIDILFQVTHYSHSMDHLSTRQHLPGFVVQQIQLRSLAPPMA